MRACTKCCVLMVRDGLELRNACSSDERGSRFGQDEAENRTGIVARHNKRAALPQYVLLGTPVASHDFLPPKLFGGVEICAQGGA